MARINLGEVVKGAEQLSLGISIVVAILIGSGAGYWIMKETGWTWTLFAGVAVGIAAAALNVKKAYDAQIKSLDELKDKGKFKPAKDDDEDDE
ncbi:MAG: AtpZ/AtpI family protein [Campylobacter sp.]|jgi:arginine biosynthesis bifunctional protein argJ|uniref:AtpZ/AtpI family protein n=1 Tax=Campylobacter sp. TaxID=205 RepID=UPI0028D485A7|nr:AtpZ/AtpI family protein [uncultured Campylobacter sp.]